MRGNKIRKLISTFLLVALAGVNVVCIYATPRTAMSFSAAVPVKAQSGAHQASAGERAFSAVLTESPYYASASLAKTTGNITAGKRILTVAESSTFSVNQGIYIAGAGASGDNYVGTITSIAGNTINVNPAALTSVSGAVVQHDNTEAFKSALAAVAKAGGGAVLVPWPGLNRAYNVNGPLDPVCNAVICLPQNPWTGSNMKSIPIAIVGEVPPSWGDYQVLG